MKKSIVLIAVGVSLFLTGCEETKSVDWWKDHHEEALKKETECKKTGSDSQNCQNVKQANFEYQQLHAKHPDDAGMLDKYLKG